MEDSIALRGVPPLVIVAALLAAISALYTLQQRGKAQGPGITDSAGYRVTPSQPLHDRPRSSQIALTFALHFGIMLAGCTVGSLLLGFLDPEWLLIYGSLFVAGCVLAVVAYRLNRPR